MRLYSPVRATSVIASRSSMRTVLISVSIWCSSCTLNHFPACRCNDNTNLCCATKQQESWEWGSLSFVPLLVHNVCFLKLNNWIAREVDDKDVHRPMQWFSDIPLTVYSWSLLLVLNQGESGGKYRQREREPREELLLCSGASGCSPPILLQSCSGEDGFC